MIRSLVVGFALAILAAGCGSPEQCSAYTASTFSKCTNVKACCTDTKCRYTADGNKTWECNGTDCQSAATKLVSDCL